MNSKANAWHVSLDTHAHINGHSCMFACEGILKLDTALRDYPQPLCGGG